LAEPSKHKFLIHQRGDDVGVATRDIGSGETVTGIFMDDGSSVEVESKAAIPLSHKISISDLEPNADVIEYGVRIGRAPEGLAVGDYVHTHNIKTARW
jgi:(2R)-sulfolactate sulfo-lyase subunit alpha